MNVNATRRLSRETASGEQVQRQKRVLLVSNTVMHYRVPVYNEFHGRFAELGYQFSVLTNRLQPQNTNRLEFDLQELDFNFTQYRRAISKIDPDVVILFLHLKEAMLWPLIHWLRWRSTPFAFWTKGGNWDEAQSRFRFEAFNYVHRLADGLILYSADCRKFIRPSLHGKTFVANNTINFKEFPEITASKEEIRREFDIPFAKSVIFIGRMDIGGGRKRVDHLIDIFARLDRTDIGLLLVGSGMPPELMQRINRANTRCLGEVHDARQVQISKLCKLADVCAIPGHVGLGINQAFYWGLPVVTEDTGQPPEIGYLKPGKNGFIVPPNDLDALQERLLYLLDNDDVRAEFSRHARADILREASIENMFKGFKDCVESMMGERGDRS